MGQGCFASIKTPKGEPRQKLPDLSIIYEYRNATAIMPIYNFLIHRFLKERLPSNETSRFLFPGFPVINLP